MFKPAGASCGDPSNTECTDPDTCNGSGICQPNNAAAGTACGDAGSACTNQDTCNATGTCTDNGFKPAGAACGDQANTECTDPDTCNGTGTCQPNNAAVGTACGDAGTQCTNQDTCNATGTCTDNGFKASGTPCGSSSDTVCDNPDTCNATGTCQANNEPTTTVCRADAGECDLAETCAPGGTCPNDAFEPAGTACGSASDTVCDNPDTCNASGACQANNEPTTTVCRADAGDCDVAETCQPGGVCPDNGFEPAGTACGSNADTVCDNPDTCNATGTCQANNEPTTTVCRADAGECDVAETCAPGGTCPDDAFEPAGTACGSPSDTVCDNPDTCNASGACQANNEPTTTVCRADAGECDVAETCAAGGVCPADAFEPAGTSCGSNADTVCDNPDTCNATGQCLANNEPTTTVCRADAGDCDAAETCEAGGVCPADAFEPAGTACGSNADTVCDNPDTCSATGQCQANNEPTTTVCRPDAGDCDVAETCAVGGVCPADTFEPAGTTCGSNSDTICDNPDTCNNVGQCQANNELPTTVCREATDAVCDVAETCLAGACPADVVAAEGTACNDGDVCTFGDTCDGAGSCEEGPGDACGIGKVTGGGQVVPNTGDKASFGFVAQRQTVEGLTSGHFNYVNHFSGLHVNGPVTLLVVFDAISALFQGTGVCNGLPCTFEVKVTDNGEPGKNDKIQVAVFSASPAEATPERTIKNGNIQVHKSP